jgi:hypothetical protein
MAVTLFAAWLVASRHKASPCSRLLVVHREQRAVDRLGLARPRLGAHRAAGGIVRDELCVAP